MELAASGLLMIATHGGGVHATMEDAFSVHGALGLAGRGSPVARWCGSLWWSYLSDTKAMRCRERQCCGALRMQCTWGHVGDSPSSGLMQV
jgi:hypothetical protein